MVARTAELSHNPSDVQSGIITQYPDEWKNFQDNQSTIGIYSTQDNNTSELLQSLVTWAHNNKGEGQSILLLIDDLEALTKLDHKPNRTALAALRDPAVFGPCHINASRARTWKPGLASSAHAYLDAFTCTRPKFRGQRLEITVDFVRMTIYHARRE
jgi:hypothetical protein